MALGMDGAWHGVERHLAVCIVRLLLLRLLLNGGWNGHLLVLMVWDGANNKNRCLDGWVACFVSGRYPLCCLYGVGLAFACMRAQGGLLLRFLLTNLLLRRLGSGGLGHRNYRLGLSESVAGDHAPGYDRCLLASR